MAVQNATVVKKPNTFCALTKLECILTGIKIEVKSKTRCTLALDT